MERATAPKERKLKRRVAPDRVDSFGFDSEDNSKGHCHLLVFYDGRNYYEFSDHERALAWLLLSKFDGHVVFWCGNTEYDLNNLVGHYIYLIDRLYSKGRFICATLWNNPLVRFYELRNFYVTNVASIGQMMGYKKLSFDFKKRKFDKDGKVILSQRELTYCRRDTLIVQKAGKHILEMFIKNEIGLCATVASTALQIYLSKYDPVDLSRPTRNNYIIDHSLVRKSYVGGRCEVFRVGRYKERMTYIDVNSLYPYCMKNFMYPNPMSELKYVKHDDIDNGVIHAKVKVSETYIPVLPLYYNNKLCFPTGTFTGVWTLPEYTYALKHGMKPLKIYGAYTWKDEIDLFSDYVDDMYANRMNAKTPAEKQFYKIVMNGLYGKFAEKNSIMKFVPLDEGTFRDPIFAGRSIVEEEYLPAHAHVILSSYVTSYARIILHSTMQHLTDIGCKVYYCDTDSIIFSGNHKGYIQDSKKLGEWKIEYNITDAEFRAPKYYRFKSNNTWYYRCKGVNADMQKQAFEQDEVVFMKPIRWNESFRRHIKANVWIEHKKRLTAYYDKRIILRTGNTRPITLTGRNV